MNLTTRRSVRRPARFDKGLACSNRFIAVITKVPATPLQQQILDTYPYLIIQLVLALPSNFNPSFQLKTTISRLVVYPTDCANLLRKLLKIREIKHLFNDYNSKLS